MAPRGLTSRWRRRLGNAARRTLLIDQLVAELATLRDRQLSLVAELAAMRLEQLDAFNALSQLNQLNLTHHYRSLQARSQALTSLEDAEFRVYSQNGEDGILHYLFTQLGVTNKQCVEMCAGQGRECNTANLIINHGWNGFLFDGDAELVAHGQNFFARLKDTLVWPPTFVQAWITAENVNALIANHGVTGEIDLLSLDLDGVDWWIWRALEVVSPRVVVLEYQDCWPADVAVTVPYRPDFVGVTTASIDSAIPPLAYMGASLAAFVKLGRKKGYRYVGSERLGYNAFFIRDGLGETLFPAVPAAQGLSSAANLEHQAQRRPMVAGLEWVNVDTVL